MEHAYKLDSLLLLINMIGSLVGWLLSFSQYIAFSGIINFIYSFTLFVMYILIIYFARNHYLYKDLLFRLALVKPFMMGSILVLNLI